MAFGQVRHFYFFFLHSKIFKKSKSGGQLWDFLWTNLGSSSTETLFSGFSLLQKHCSHGFQTYPNYSWNISVLRFYFTLLILTGGILCHLIKDSPYYMKFCAGCKLENSREGGTSNQHLPCADSLHKPPVQHCFKMKPDTMCRRM